MSNPSYEKRYTKVFVYTVTPEEAPHDFYADCDYEIRTKVVIQHTTTDRIYEYVGYGYNLMQAYEDALETKRTNFGEMHEYERKIIQKTNFWFPKN